MTSGDEEAREGPPRGAEWRTVARRTLPFLATALGITACCAAVPALAADADPWPLVSEPFQRGPGYYLQPVKIGFFLVLFWLWIKTTEWVNMDAWNLKLNYRMWNPVVTFTFFTAVLLMFMIPTFWISAPLLLIALGGPLGVYLKQRSKNPDAEPVAESFRKVLTLGGRVGKKKKGEAGAEVEYKIKFNILGGTNAGERQAATILARNSAGMPVLQEVLTEAFAARAEALNIETGGTLGTILFQVDGFDKSAPMRERAKVDGMLATLRTLCVFDPKDASPKQTGRFGIESEKGKLEGRLSIQRTNNGEKASLRLSDPRLPWASMEEIGLREKLVETLNGVLNRPNGLVVFSALPGHGLSTTMDMVLKTRDRYMREFVAIEEAGKNEREIENVPITKYNAAAGETPLPALQKLIRTYPNGFVLREMADPETIKVLCEQTQDEKLVFCGIKAKDSVESLLRVLMLKVPAKEFAKALTGAVNTRLLRKLCDECKVAYKPSDEQLQQLGLPAGRVQQMFNPKVWQPPVVKDKKVPPPCTKCGGIGYFGRTALFEVLIVNDEFREALIKTPKLEILRPLARKIGMRTLQEEGILLCARGVTNVAEVARVLKQ